LRRKNTVDLLLVAQKKNKRTLANALIQPLSGLMAADFVKCILPQKVTRATPRGRHPLDGLLPISSLPKIRLDVPSEIIQESLLIRKPTFQRALKSPRQ